MSANELTPPMVAALRVACAAPLAGSPGSWVTIQHAGTRNALILRGMLRTNPHWNSTAVRATVKGRRALREIDA